MPTYSVSSRGLDTVEIDAPNWVAALGLGLASWSRDHDLERLACERLQNGTVIARDIGTGTGFVIQSVEPATDDDDLVEVDLELEPLTEEVERADLETMLAEIEDADSRSSASALALTIARELVPAESGAVLLEDRGYLRFISVVGPNSKRLRGVRLPLGTGVAGFAMERQRTVVLDDAHDDPRHCREVDALTGYTTEQIAVVPVCHEGRCFGAIELINLPGDQRFDPVGLERLERVAMALGERLAD